MEFGDKARDRISGFCGILTAKTAYSNGCVKWLVQPESLDKDGKPAEGHWFDEQDIRAALTKKIGGPMPLAPRG